MMWFLGILWDVVCFFFGLGWDILAWFFENAIEIPLTFGCIFSMAFLFFISSFFRIIAIIAELFE